MTTEWGRIAYDNEILNKEFTIVEKSDDYSMVTSDFGKCIVLTGAVDKTFTLPDSSETYEGKRIRCEIFGTAMLTIEPYSEGTINNKAKLESIHQYAWIELILTAANTWTIYSSSKKNTVYNYGSWELLESSGYQYYKTITIHHEKVSGSENLTDLPFLIKEIGKDYLKLKSNNGNITDIDGFDIIFTSDESGETQLDHEIELYNGTNGDFIAWVRIPTLKYNEDTIIYIHYSNDAISSSQENIDDVWDTNYKGVWHLREDGDGTEDEFKDSSGNNNHGEGGAGDEGATPTLTTEGRIGNAQSFDDDDDYIHIPNSASLDITGNISLSAWIKRNAVNDYGDIITKGNRSNLFNFNLYIGSSSNKLNLYSTDTVPTGAINTDGAIGGTMWYYIVVTRSGSTVSFYINGVHVGDDDMANQFGDDHPLQIGASGYLDGDFNGLIDEARISNIARDADWIATSYNNQNSPELFYRVT